MLKSFPSKKLVFKAGDPADFAYVIRSGTVEIFKIIDGKEVVLAEIKKGSIFGEMALYSLNLSVLQNHQENRMEH